MQKQSIDTSPYFELVGWLRRLTPKEREVADVWPALAMRPRIAILVALGAPVVAAAIQLLIWPWIEPTYFILFFPTVLISAFFGGTWGGLTSSILSGLLADFLFMEPRFQFHLQERGLPRIIVFAVDCGIITLTTSYLTRQLRLRLATQTEFILSRMANPVLLLDNKLKFVYANAPALRGLGNKSLEAVRGKILFEVLPEANGTLEYYQQVLNTRQPCHFDFHLEREGWFETHIYALENGLAVFAHEITERKKTEQEREEYVRQLAQLNQDLARSNAELEQFAHIASHDLKEPLRGITTSMQLLELQYGGLLDERAKTYLHFAVSGAKRLHGMINDILSLAKISSVQREVADVSLSSVVREALQALVSPIKESGAILRMDSLPHVRADHAQLVQVMQNLIANALKFHKPGQAPEIVVTAQDGGKEWIIAVKDNGIGIDPKHASAIFGLFKRLHARDQYPGSGIGLALCKKIVERMDGRIWVDSTPGVGSTFQIALPQTVNSRAVL